MKKYYINIRNDKKKIVFAILLVCYLTFIAIAVLAWISAPIVGILWTGLAVFVLAVTFNSLICMFTNYFTYNPETKEITLKRFRQKDRTIGISQIEKIVIKDNNDPMLGAMSGRNTTPFAVKSREGYDYFFIEENDPILEQFFADHGIPTLRYYKEES